MISSPTLIDYQVIKTALDGSVTPYTPIPVFGSGLLSRAIQNLQGSIQELVKLTGLPVEAHNRRNSAVSLLAAKIKKITATQPAVQQFVTNALPPLQQAKANLDAGTNLDQVASIITRTTTLAATLKQNVDALSVDIQATKTQIIDLSASLALIQSQIQHVQNILHAQIQAITDELKNPWAAFGDVLTGRANKLSAEVNMMSAQIEALNRYKQSVESMIADFSDVVNQISNAGNAIYFVASDDSEVIDD